jgi:hypothetical protein
MLNFFRTIRKKLIEQDNVRNYLLYAIGEILLVVFGILIALQVNNWNQERKLLEQESNLLVNLNQEFSENLVILENEFSTIEDLFLSLETILDLMHDGPGDLSVSEFEILLQKTFTSPVWYPSSIILEELKNSGGFSQLSDPELRKLLFEWERDFNRLKSIQEGYNYYAQEFIDYLTDHGSPRNLDAIGGSIPSLKRSTIARNELSLLTDPKFEGRVDNFYFYANSLITKYKESSERMRVIKELTQ